MKLVPTSPDQQTQVFDRSRLLVDLDEATEPGAPPGVLVVIGLHGLGEAFTDRGSNPVVDKLRAQLNAIVGDSGSTYSTRLTELCAILDGALPSLNEVLAAIHDGFARQAARSDVRVSIGFVELPGEALDALDALAIADRRMTAADGPIRYD